MTNHPQDLIDLMREFGVEALVLGPLDEPDPSSPALAAMLEEIHRLRSTHPATAPDVPEWVHHIEAHKLPNGRWSSRCSAVFKVKLENTRRTSGAGSTWQEAIAAALADASKDGGQ